MTDRREAWDKKRKLLRMQRLAIRTIPEDKLNAAFTPQAAKALADYSIALEGQIEKLEARITELNELADVQASALQNNGNDWAKALKERDQTMRMAVAALCGFDPVCGAALNGSDAQYRDVPIDQKRCVADAYFTPGTGKRLFPDIEDQ